MESLKGVYFGTSFVAVSPPKTAPTNRLSCFYVDTDGTLVSFTTIEGEVNTNVAFNRGFVPVFVKSIESVSGGVVSFVSHRDLTL